MASTDARLPVTHRPTRVAARDAKLLRRKEYFYDRRDVEDRRGRRPGRVKCQCNLCMASSWSARSRAMASQHVLQIGRHPICRGRTEVSTPPAPYMQYFHAFYFPCRSSIAWSCNVQLTLMNYSRYRGGIQIHLTMNGKSISHGNMVSVVKGSYMHRQRKLTQV